MSGELGKHGELLVQLKDGFLLATNVTSQRLDALDQKQTETTEKFNMLLDSLKTWRENLRRSIQNNELTDMALARLIGFMGYLHQLTVSEVLTLTTIEQEAERYQLSINMLTEGKLPPYFVNIYRLKQALRAVTTKLATSSNMVVSHLDMSFYYKHHLVLAMHNENCIVINLKIPVHSPTAVMRLYRVESYLVPHSGHASLGQTIITELPKYIAISSTGNYFAELDQDQVRDCTRQYCHHTFPISPYSVPSCALAVFRSMNSEIPKLCKINYAVKTQRRELAKSLGNGHYLLSSVEGWTVSCRSVPPRNVPPCGLCVFKLPCDCSLYSKQATLLPSNSDCIGNDQDSLVLRYPFNAIVLHAFYSSSQFHTLSGATLLNEPLNLSLPARIEPVIDSQDSPRATMPGPPCSNMQQL